MAEPRALDESDVDRPPDRSGRRNGGSTSRPAHPAVPDDVKDRPGPAVGLWTVLGALLVMLAMAAAFLASESREPVYAAVADILISSGDDQPAQQTEREVATQAVLLVSRNVVAPVAESRGLSFDELSERLSVEIPGGTNVLRLRVEAEDRNVARGMADGIVDRYLETFLTAAPVSDDVAEVLEAEVARLTAELEEINERVNELDAARGGDGSLATRSAEQVRLESRAALLSQRIGGVQDRVLAAELERRTRPQPVIVADAWALPEAVSPTMVQSVAAAGLTGVLVAGTLLTVAVARRQRWAGGTSTDPVGRP